MSDYVLGADSMPQEGVPQGQLLRFRWTSHTVSAGVDRDVRLCLSHGIKSHDGVNLLNEYFLQRRWSSRAARQATAAGPAIHNATSGAVMTLIHDLAAEVGTDIRVNAVNPVDSRTGFIQNALGMEELAEAARAEFTSNIPMGRIAVPQDVASAVVFLVSDQAGFLTGV